MRTRRNEVGYEDLGRGLEKRMEFVFGVLWSALHSKNLLPHVQISKNVERKEIVLTFCSGDENHMSSNTAADKTPELSRCKLDEPASKSLDSDSLIPPGKKAFGQEESSMSSKGAKPLQLPISFPTMHTTTSDNSDLEKANNPPIDTNQIIWSDSWSGVDPDALVDKGLANEEKQSKVILSQNARDKKYECRVKMVRLLCADATHKKGISVIPQDHEPMIGNEVTPLNCELLLTADEPGITDIPDSVGPSKLSVKDTSKCILMVDGSDNVEHVPLSGRATIARFPTGDHDVSLDSPVDDKYANLAENRVYTNGYGPKVEPGNLRKLATSSVESNPLTAEECLSRLCHTENDGGTSLCQAPCLDIEKNTVSKKESQDDFEQHGSIPPFNRISTIVDENATHENNQLGNAAASELIVEKGRYGSKTHTVIGDRPSKNKTSKRKRKKIANYNRSKQCESCDYRCRDNFQLKRHFACRHLKVKAESLYPKAIKIHKCDQCEYSGKSLKRLKTHIGTNHTMLKSFQCKFCPYQTANEEFYKNHNKKHTTPKLSQKPLKALLCESCDYSCSDKSLLNNHIAMKHSKERPFQCPLCPYRTAVKKYLDIHSKRHSDKRFMCDDCDFRSHTSAELQQHRLCMHSTEKTKSCQYCSYMANSTSALLGHVKRKHFRDVKMTQMKCEHCTYTTDDPYCMKKHIVQHNEATHECQVCGKKYKSPRCLKDHMLRVHDKEKMLTIQCSHCELKFKTKSELRSHMSYVTGEVPFSCRICNAGYVYKFGLENHFKHHHLGETIFYCGACEFGTNSKNALKVHEGGSLHQQKLNHFQSIPDFSETEKVLHKCTKCAYSNTSLACLKRHVSIKHLPRE